MCTHDTAYALQDLDNREGFFFPFISQMGWSGSNYFKRQD